MLTLHILGIDDDNFTAEEATDENVDNSSANDNTLLDTANSNKFLEVLLLISNVVFCDKQ